MLKKLFDFFVFTSLFIALCAVLMVYQTSLLFNVRFQWALYAFVFFGSVCSYNLHWFLTPPHIPEPTYKLKWNITNRSLHLILFIVGAAGAGITAFLLIEHWFWLGVTALFTFLYSAPMIDYAPFIWLRKIAIGKTIYLALAWAHITSFLPLAIKLKTVEPQHLWYLVNRFFFIYAICIVFDRRDVENDRKAGIKSLITFFSEKGTDRLFWFSIVMVFTTCIILSRWLSWLDVSILFFPSIVMGLLYEPSKKNFSDYLYYFVLDGLMALSAPILILAKFAR